MQLDFISPIESDDLTSARQYYMKTKDAEGTLKILPQGRPLERALLQGLAKREGLNDYLGALKCVSQQSEMYYRMRGDGVSSCPDSIQFSADVHAQLPEPGLE